MPVPALPAREGPRRRAVTRPGRAAVEAAERYADDPAAGNDLRRAQVGVAATHQDWLTAREAARAAAGKLDRFRQGLQPDEAVIWAVRWAAADDVADELDRTRV